MEIWEEKAQVDDPSCWAAIMGVGIFPFTVSGERDHLKEYYSQCPWPHGFVFVIVCGVGSSRPV